MSLFGSLIGGVLGLFGKKKDDKAAQRAAEEANRNAAEAAQRAADIQAQQQLLAYEQTVTLQQMQNDQVNSTNSLIDLHNKTVGGTTNFASMVRDAESAGFNPLTVLRAGGAAGYSVPFMTFMSHSGQSSAPQPLPVPVAVTHQRQATSSWADFATSIGTGVSNFLNRDPLAGERASLELGIARAQLANLNSDTNANNRRFAIPTWTGTGVTSSAGGFVGAAASALGLPTKWEAGDVKVTNPIPGGAGVVNSSFADAAAYEERYGEFGGSILGVGNIIADAYTNVANTGYFQAQYKALTDAWARAGSPSADAQRAVINGRLFGF